ncbi:MAG: M48 family metallopeptidase [Gammaproteobacteria bacterium]|nr:M48 family metallopeptidase [Gammaproteobacteria bacterium]
MNSTPFRLRRPGRRPIAWLIFFFLYATILPPGFGQSIALPEFGDPSGNLLSPSSEKRLGQAFMRSVRSNYLVLSDPLLEAYIESLGQRLATAGEHAGRSFHFFVIDNPAINAFAGPGGYIGINTGLITTTESESELASVIAHEIAHVTQNHLIRTFDAVQRMSLPVAALAITALVLGAATKSPDAGVAVASGLQAGLAQRQINFTRAHEEEADSIGIDTLAKSGFDPQAMGLFFSRMGQATRLYQDGTLPEFLRTHPVTSNRIADAHGRAERYPYRQLPDSLAYHLARVTLKQRQFSTPANAVAYFRESLKSQRYRNEESQRYGYALALIAAHRYKEAEKVLLPLIRERPEEIAYIDANARLLQESGRGTEAITALRDGLSLYPDNRVLGLRLGELLLTNGSPGEALQLLERQLQLRPEEMELYRLAARAAGESGEETRGYLHLAEYHYLNGELEAAIQKLRDAIKNRAIDYYLDARISARLRALEDELNELKSRDK